MARDVTSPFSPGRPVPVEFFVGRQQEIKRLRRIVRDSLSGRLEAVFVSGERGIGKSSLVSFVRHLGEKDDSVLGVHALLGNISTVEGAVKRVLDSLLKEASGDSTLSTIRDLFGKYVRSAGLYGISLEFDVPEKELRNLADNFASFLRSLYEKNKKNRRGILLILDDINGLAESTTFANWLKSFLDEVSVSKTLVPVCLAMVGLEERRHSLVERQESLARVFHLVDIRAWSEEESHSFFVKTFDKAGIKCREPALKLMADFAGGLPVLAHEIGDATFQLDADSIITRDEAWEGVTAAADIVGRKYVNPVVYKSLRSRRYRGILRKMAKGFRLERFTRSAVRERLADDEKRAFDNFLRKMKELGVLEEDQEGGRGSYRFGTRLHYLFFAMEAADTKDRYRY